MIRISSGGATRVKRASLFAKAATNASGKCLKTRIHGNSYIIYKNIIFSVILNTYVELRKRSDR